MSSISTIGYKFVVGNFRSRAGREDRPWTIGQVRNLRSNQVLSACVRGYHSSDTPVDAYKYVSSDICMKVQRLGEMVVHPDPATGKKPDKVAAQGMRVLSINWVGDLNLQMAYEQNHVLALRKEGLLSDDQVTVAQEKINQRYNQNVIARLNQNWTEDIAPWERRAETSRTVYELRSKSPQTVLDASTPIAKVVGSSLSEDQRAKKRERDRKYRERKRAGLV